jgi:NAD(P)H-flavin reductase
MKWIRQNRSSYKIPDIPDMQGDIPDEIRYRYWGIMTKHIRDEKDKNIGQFVNLAENIFEKYDVNY